MARGKIGPYLTDTILTPRDCNTIGKISMSKIGVGMAAEWFITGFHLLKTTKSSDIDKNLIKSLRRQKIITELMVIKSNWLKKSFRLHNFKLFFVQHDEHLEALEEKGESSSLLFTQPLENNQGNRTRQSTILRAATLNKNNFNKNPNSLPRTLVESLICSGYNLLVRPNTFFSYNQPPLQKNFLHK